MALVQPVFRGACGFRVTHEGMERVLSAGASEFGPSFEARAPREI